jgi:hypothetical protein
MVDGYSEYQYRMIVKDSVLEAVNYYWEDLSDDERADLTGENCFEWLDEHGRIHEVVDGCVPVYTYSGIQTWLNIGMPEAEDYGGENTGTIVEQVQAGIYYWADAYVREMFDDWFEEFVHSKTLITEEDA